ncbi:MAG: coiled-coil domain-containing protein [Bacteroidales bacterium]|nr:hypothetical protein [Bacteroidales bacterium]
MKIVNYLTIMLLATFLWSCNGDEVKRLKEENSRLYKEIEDRDNIVNDMFKSFNDIEQNLAEIRAKEMIIKRESSVEISDDNSDVRDRISEEIQMINGLIEKNKTTIKRLQEQMKTSNIKISELEKTIDKLTKKIEEKDVEIETLKLQLEEMNIKVDELNINIEELTADVAQKTETIQEQTEKMNQAFYVFGSRSELLEKEIITRQGGVIGIGKYSKVSRNITADYFTQIDVRKTTEISLMCKQAKLLSSHPDNTWEFVESKNTVEKIVIKDYEKFWSLTKYLVIEIK